MDTTLVQPNTASRPKNRLKRVAVGSAILLMLLLGLLRYVGVFGGNIRTVEEGRVYRSANIYGKLLDDTLQSKGIRTVLNLRGGVVNGVGDAKYLSEAQSCKQLGVKMIDLPFSAVRYPPPKVLENILKVFDTEAYPILFHCRGGSDRSGLTGTLYLHLYKNIPLDEAQSAQLTWHYGHLSWGQAHAMDDFLNLYRKTANGMELRKWITAKYPALYDALPDNLKVK
ncbi:MAG: tyrosine-protein phosphatase [Armatimonadetes bacterium]|nr:tyrosine-protein phosphatase [Armatimonadota bacterium]